MPYKQGEWVPWPSSAYIPIRHRMAQVAKQQRSEAHMTPSEIRNRANATLRHLAKARDQFTQLADDMRGMYNAETDEFRESAEGKELRDGYEFLYATAATISDVLKDVTGQLRPHYW